MSGAMLPPPDGVWGMPQEMLKTIIGYGDVAKSREEARELMKQAGYGPDKRLKVKVSTRNIATFRDPATILIDQLQADLGRRRARGHRHRGLLQPRVQEGLRRWRSTSAASAVDDPDVTFFEGYACGSLRNYNSYCNPEMTKLFEAQSQRDSTRRSA